MKPLILVDTLGLTAGVVVASQPAATRGYSGRIGRPQRSHSIGTAHPYRKSPMKTFILASLLALAAVSGVVLVSGPAAAHPFGGGVAPLSGSGVTSGSWRLLNEDIPCVIWWIASDQLKTAQVVPCQEDRGGLYTFKDAGLGLERKTTA